MDSKDRVELFLKFQNQNMSFEDISKKLEIKPATLRKTLNRNGYKSNKGIYVKSADESQISFEDINNINEGKKSIKGKAKGNEKKSKKLGKEIEGLDKKIGKFGFSVQKKKKK